MVLRDLVVAYSFLIQLHLHLSELFICESCIAIQLRDLLVSSSDPVVQGSVCFELVVFLCLDYLGQDFGVVIVALIGDL